MKQSKLQDTISVAALNSLGKLALERILETKASTVVRFAQGYGEICT